MLRSCAYADLNSAEVFSFTGCGVHQRQECNSDSTEVWREAEELCGTAFLGEGILCVNGGTRGGDSAAIYPTARIRGSADRAITTH